MSDVYSVPLKCRGCGKEWDRTVEKGSEVQYEKGEGVEILKEDDELNIVNCPSCGSVRDVSKYVRRGENPQ